MQTKTLRRILSTLAAVALLAVAGAPGSAQAPPAPQAPQVVEFKLANGVQVVVVPDRRARVVTHMIYYKVGSADDPAGKSGIAHFLEHLMFSGTAANPAGRFSQAVSAVGGYENAFTSLDYTAYFQRVPRDFLGQAMAFEADRMTGLALTDANVQPEREVVLEEHNLRVEGSPEERLGEMMLAALYRDHPYGKPVIGWRREIEALGREDAIAFYRRFYGPDNAVVVIAGDVAPADARALAEQTYGRVPAAAAAAARPWPRRPALDEAVAVTLDDPLAGQPSLHRSYLAPSYATGLPGEAEALETLAQALGVGANSRLYRRLVVERKIAANVGATYTGAAVDVTRLSLHANPKPGVSLHEVEEELDAVIDDVAANGVTPDELERAKTRMIADSVYARDSQSIMARWFGAALATGSTVQDLLAWPDRIRAVDDAAVQAAARNWLDKRRSVTGYLVNSAAARAEIRP